MVLQLDFDVGKRNDGKVRVHAAVAQFDHLGGESRVCRFHIAVAGFVYQAEKIGFRQQEIIHGSVNFEITLCFLRAHMNIIGKTRVRKQKIRHRFFQGTGFQWYKIQYFSEGMNLYGLKLFVIRTFILFQKTELYVCRTFWLSCLFVKGVDTSAYAIWIAF